MDDIEHFSCFSYKKIVHVIARTPPSEQNPSKNCTKKYGHKSGHKYGHKYGDKFDYKFGHLIARYGFITLDLHALVAQLQHWGLELFWSPILVSFWSPF